jgi:2-C-methyl-D-erythritol 4-phosphate cytidylyltransferase/2-C-methyl-D-erythritol 2,4-cyclodiphosphate synthase
MKTVAIIPAGGAGRRLNASKAKQYLQINRLPVLVHTLNVFEKAKIIDEVILVVPEPDMKFVREDLIFKNKIKKVTKIIAGGIERQDSVRHGIAAVYKCDIVLVHDGVRPFVTQEMINCMAEIVMDIPAAVIGVQSNDTIKETKDGDIVDKTVPRRNLWITQTPQAFQFEILRRAYEAAYSDNFYGTDDASLVERIGIPVKMIAGSYKNIKITTKEDMIIAEALLKGKQEEKSRKIRTGLGYDSHRFAEGRKLILGGVAIPCEKGLQGHSDADVLIHALCDALLGAAGAGDIGRHFPDNDLAYKDISSMILLQRVREIIEEKGFFAAQVDVSIIMEAPKLAPFADSINANIAEALNIPVSNVNVKAKTNEGMGFTGRREGAAVFAVATVMTT